MTPLADDMQHALLDERHQLGECRVETGRSEAVTSETGIDLHMHTGGFAETTRGLGHAVDTTKRTDGNVDIVGNQLIERHRGAVVDPCQNMAAVQADTGLAQQERLMRLCGAEPSRAARQGSQGCRNQAMAIGVGFDHAHHGRTRIRSADHAHQVAHVVTQRGQIDDRLRRIPPTGRLIIRLALVG